MALLIRILETTVGMLCISPLHYTVGTVAQGRHVAHS
jgi:hypothetical protein